MVRLVLDVNNRRIHSGTRVFTMYFKNKEEMNKFLINLDLISKVRFTYVWENVDSIPEDEDSDETEVSEDVGN